MKARRSSSVSGPRLSASSTPSAKLCPSGTKTMRRSTALTGGRSEAATGRPPAMYSYNLTGLMALVSRLSRWGRMQTSAAWTTLATSARPTGG